MFERVICINAISVGAGLPAMAVYQIHRGEVLASPVGAGLLAMAVHQMHRGVAFAGKPAPTKAVRSLSCKPGQGAADGFQTDRARHG
ncbi:hypothetical protein EI969_15600 [Pseudomonas sp. PB101]|nr:hypothetical protein [Pseudomonas sp. PB101]